MRHTRDVTEGTALPSQNSWAGRQRVSHKRQQRTDGITLRPLSELLKTLLRLISRRHVGAGNGVRGAAGDAVAGGADGSREGRARRAELLQLQQTGACGERTDTFHHSNNIKSIEMLIFSSCSDLFLLFIRWKLFNKCCRTSSSSLTTTITKLVLEFFLSLQLGALHEVLERLQTKRINPWEKKYGQVPSVSPRISLCHTHTNIP